MEKVQKLWKMIFFGSFQKAVTSQPVDGFFCPTPEMKAMDAYVAFLLSKPLNKNEIAELFCRKHLYKISTTINKKYCPLIFRNFVGLTIIPHFKFI